jgi:MFS family permease
MASKAEQGAMTKARPTAGAALIPLSLAMLLASLGTSIANVALPTLGAAFDAPLGELQWVVLAYLLAVTAGVAGAGRLGDRLGRRRLLLGGLALFTLASLLCAAAPSLSVLILARIGQGFGAAAMMALAMATAMDAAPEKTGSALGLLGAMSAAGTALGPALGGLLIALGGWRALFVLCAVGAAAAWLLALRQLPAATPRVRRSTGQRGAPARLRVRDPQLASGLIAGALAASVVMAALVVGPFYLTYGLHQDAARVGLILSIGPVVAALAGVPAGRLTDRFGAAKVGAGGLGLMAGGCAALALLPLSLGVPGYVMPIAATTLGFALFQTANNSLVMGRAPGAQRGSAAGLLTLFRNAGLIAGASGGALLFASALAGQAPAAATPQDVGAAVRLSFAAAAAAVALALAISLAARAGAALEPKA